LGDVVEVVGVEVLVFFVEILLLLIFLIEVVGGGDLLLFGPVGIALDFFHEFDLISESFSPELLSLIEFGFPIGEFLLQLLDIIIVGVMNSQKVLFLFFEHVHLPFGLDLIHFVL
jgi:hypothetical protein